MDVVVTCPKNRWNEWLAEGDLPGDKFVGDPFDDGYGFSIGRNRPSIEPGERVYVVAHGKLRGYAPLVQVYQSDEGRFYLIRAGGAVACTIDEPITSFMGWRYRWWDVKNEEAFEGWKVP